MAVYQGTQRPVLIPGARRRAAPMERRARRIPIRAQRRARPIAIALVFIVAVFMVALVYLTQSLQTAAVQFQIDQLRSDQTELHRQIQTQQGTIARWGAEPQVVEWAQQNGLGQLGGTIHVPAR